MKLAPRLAALALALVAAAALAGCGDDVHAHAGGPDARAGGPDAAPGTDAGPSATAVIVAGDFNVTGFLSTVSLPDLTVTPNAVAGVAGGDPFLRRWGDELFVVNRDSGDNVTILDRGTLQLVQQLATGSGSNPQDAAPVGRKVYVPALGTAGVVVLDRDHPGSPTTIDLSSLDPADGLPDCISAYPVGTTLYVACGLLDDNFQARGPAKVAVIDTTTDTMIGSFDLPASNPIGFFVRTPDTSTFGGDLVIGLAPSFTDYATGCLARVGTGASPAADGCAATNADLGGLANHYEVSPDGAALWIDVTTYDSSFNLSGKVVAQDLATGELGTPMTGAGEVITDVAACPGGWAVVVDGTFGAAGVRVYEDGAELTTDALDIGGAPAYGNNVTCF
jgi:hypothetical protein